MGKQYVITFGVLAPKISAQLHSQSLRFEHRLSVGWQRDADAITRLSVRQLLTEAETKRARKRLLQQILARCREA